VKDRELEILRHALGYDSAGNDRYHGAPTDERRNRFVTGPGSDDWATCQSCVAEQWMVDAGTSPLLGGDHLFQVTDAGRALVLKHKPAQPKLSRSQQRYRRFLRVDCGMRFGEWLKLREAA
jgi:hypothetical protein